MAGMRVTDVADSGALLSARYYEDGYPKLPSCLDRGPESEIIAEAACMAGARLVGLSKIECDEDERDDYAR
jgi:hypothetical protein